MSPDRIAYLIELADESGSTPIEGALAAAFVRKHADEYIDFDFQKRVGHGVVLPPETPDDQAKVWFHATRKRVDLVAYTNAGAVLVEVKDWITWPAIGQVSEYRDLWTIAPQSPPVIGLMIIGRTIDAGIDKRAADAGIQIELFPDLSGFESAAGVG